MPYEIALKEVPQMNVISIRKNMSMKNISEDMGDCYGELYAHLQAEGGVCTACMAVYHCGETFDPDNFDAECCFAVETPLPEKGRIQSRTLPGGLMVGTIHKGPYMTLEGAYNALAKWVEENGYEYDGPMRDVYLNDPAQVPAEELLTEVLFPVRKG